MENLCLYCISIGILHEAGAGCRRTLGKEGTWNKELCLVSDSVSHSPLFSLSLFLSPLPPCTAPLPCPADWLSLLLLHFGTLAKAPEFTCESPSLLQMLTKIISVLVQDSRERESDGCSLGPASYGKYKQDCRGPA